MKKQKSPAYGDFCFLQIGLPLQQMIGTVMFGAVEAPLCKL
jgi:hypothetical protein